MGVPNQKKFRHSNSSKRRMAKCKPNSPTALTSPNRSEATKLARQSLRPAVSTLADHGLIAREPARIHAHAIDEPGGRGAIRCGGGVDRDSNVKARSKRARHSRAKSGKARILVPPPQIERIKGKYISGMSMRKIAAEEGRDEATVAKIVHMEDMQQYVEGIRRQYWGLGQEAVRAVLNELKRDGWLAHQVLKDIGVVPQEKQAVNLQASTQRPMTDEEEEQAVEELTARIVRASIERHKIFKMQMPQLEQMEQEEDEEQHKKRSLLERKDD